MLTKYPKGSLREIFVISFPLMLSALSGNLMLFIDRLILAQLSLDAMNSAAAAGIVCALFQFGALGISSIAEVFVGQYNGAKKYHKLAEPAWQMIWFSIMTLGVFLPFGLFAGKIFLNQAFEELGVPYYKVIMIFGPLMPLIGALTAFFVGQGKVRFVTFVTVLGNLLNVLLDFILVFGVDGWIPSLGTVGAAIATVCSLALQVLILGSVFLCRRNREKFNTGKYAFKFKEFYQCLRIGVPPAVGHMMILAAWALVTNILGSLGPYFVTVWNIAHSILIVSIFITDGLFKGVMAVTSNLIGEKNYETVPKTLGSSVKLIIGFALILSIPMLFYPEPLIDLFVKDQPIVLDEALVIQMTSQALFAVWLFFIFDGLTWIIGGILMSAGDSIFVMMMSSISAWGYYALPLYLVITFVEISPPMIWFFPAAYGLLDTIFFFWRYKTGKWKTTEVVLN